MAGIYRGGKKYEVHFELLAETPVVRDGSWLCDVMQRYVSRVEYFCRAAPYNWFNFYDFWG
jgi:predicted LPLAT superfamily acyltransferase